MAALDPRAPSTSTVGIERVIVVDRRMPVPPDLDNRHHLAISRHFKRFDDVPDLLWDNEHQCWVDARTTETWVAIYRDRVLGFFLDPAKPLTDHKLLMLMVAASYIEGHEQYRQAKSSKKASAIMFKDGIRRLFGFHDQEGLDRLYDGLRCGLFHDGMTRGGILVTGNSTSAAIHWWMAPGARERGLVVDAIQWLDTVRRDIEDYVVRIAQPASDDDRSLRANFERVWRDRTRPANESLTTAGG